MTFVSLRARIALAILLLGLATLAGVLWQTSTLTHEMASRDLEAIHEMMARGMADMAVTALVTEEFADLQVQAERLVEDPRVDSVTVADLSGLVVVSSRHALIGTEFDRIDLTNEGPRHWHVNPVTGRSGAVLGHLALEASDHYWTLAKQDQTRFRVLLSILVVGVICLFGLLTAHLLTSRLKRMGQVAQRIAAGDLALDLPVEGGDEVATLGRSFQAMLQELRSSIDTLTAQEQRFSDFASVASDWYWESGPDHRFTYVSSRACDALAMGPQDFSRRSLLELSDAEPDDEAGEQLRRTVMERRAFRGIHYSRRLAEGGTQHMRISGKPLFDPAGTFLGYRGVGSDVTAEVEAEAQRQRAEIHLARAINAIPAYCVLFDAEDRLVFCNNRYGDVHRGQGIEAVPGARHQDLVLADAAAGFIAGDEEQVQAWIETRYNRRGNLASNFEYQRTSGVWMSVSDYLLPDGAILSIALDVTDRVEAEGAMAESEARYRSLVEDQPELVARFLRDGILTFVNASYAEYFGRTVEELQGSSFYDLIPPSEREIVRTRIEAMGPGNEIAEIEHQAIASDGRVVWQQWVNRAFLDERGRVTELQAFGRDVTQQKLALEALRVSEETSARAQAQLIDAIESLGEGFALYDENDRLVICNRRLKEFYPEVAELMVPGTAFETLVRRNLELGDLPEAVGREEDWLRERLALRNQSVAMHEQLRADGQWMLVKERRTRDGKTVTTHVDITHRKRAEEDRRRHEAELALVQRRSAMGETAAALAHELNQPLAAIANYANGSLRRLADDRTKPEELQEILSLICEQAQRASDIVRHVRGFVGAETAAPEKVDLNESIRTVLSLLDIDLRGAAIRVETDLAEGLPMAAATAIETEQVVLNLLRNALDALQGKPHGQRTLDLATWHDESGLVHAMVGDSGTGIPSGDLEALFSPFVTTKPDGMGMGLSICRSIVEGRGGRIEIEARPEGGVAAHFSLPVAAGKPEARRVGQDSTELRRKTA